MKAFFKRLTDALRGWLFFFSKETNGQIQLFIAVMVIIAGFALHISVTEWMIVLTCIGVVVALEMINTAIEKICDHFHPERHPSIGIIKDVAAGAVLWAALISAIIGLVIFVPKFLTLI